MKVLIIGFGSIGRRHAEILSDVDFIEEINVVSTQKNTGYLTYNDLEKVTDLSKYDYFIIASITSLHMKQLDYINNNVSQKIILVEKPLAIKTFNIKAQNQIYVAYNLRYHPIINKIRELIQKENVLNINIHAGQYLPSWRPDRDYSKTYSASVQQGGGVLFDLSHEIDYLLWLFGAVKNIIAINMKITDLDIESDDIFTAIGVMEDKTVFNITMDYICKKPLRQILINTDENTYIADLIKNIIQCTNQMGKKIYIDTPECDRNFTYKNMHLDILKSSFECRAATFNDGIAVLELIDKIKAENYE